MIKIKHGPNLNFVILASSRLTPFNATTSRHLPRGRSPQYLVRISSVLSAAKIRKTDEITNEVVEKMKYVPGLKQKANRSNQFQHHRHEVVVEGA